jgi:hypothetical protein
VRGEKWNWEIAILRVAEEEAAAAASVGSEKMHYNGAEKVYVYERGKIAHSGGGRAV